MKLPKTEELLHCKFLLRHMNVLPLVKKNVQFCVCACARVGACTCVRACVCVSKNRAAIASISWALLLISMDLFNYIRKQSRIVIELECDTFY